MRVMFLRYPIMLPFSSAIACRGSASIVIHSVKQRLLRNQPGSDAATSRNFLHERLQRMGISVKDVNQHEFTKALAAFLKKSGKLKVPEWADIVKLGRFNELSPYDEDWFFTRAASTCRHLYIRSPAGVGAFTKIYGAKKRNGTAPSHNCRANRSVARKVLQSLESLKLVEKDPNTGGRRLTAQGRRDLDRIAAQVKSKKSEAQA